MIPRTFVRMARATTLAALGSALLPAPGAAEVRLPAIFADHMVLQRESSVAVWGWSAPLAEIEVSADFLARPVLGKADADGRFRVPLQTGAAGGPHSLVLRETGASREKAVELHDVFFGEVWLCGGQSNMEWPLGKVDGYPGIRDWQREAQDAQLPLVRLFDVPNVPAAGPQQDCQGRWRVCTPDSALPFSAVGFLFGRELQRELGVPVGLIGVNWGGTPAEAWTSAEGLAGITRYDSALANVAELRRDPQGVAARRASALARWFEDLGAPPASSAAEWRTLEQPGLWGGELEPFDGVVFLARKLNVPAEWAGQELVLELGPIDDMDTTWLDGVRIGGLEGEGHWQTPRSYRIPAAAARAGEHELCVRVLDTGGAGGLSGQPQALKLFPARSPGTTQALAGPWRAARGKAMAELPSFPSLPSLHPNLPSVLFNGMIAPILPFAIRGALFYQGESNRYDARGYARLLGALVADWRAHFGQGDFPFYFVQIAPFAYGDPGASGFLRDSQLQASRSIPNSGMVVTMDIGNPRDIHPSNKQDVAHRLVRWALARTYGRKDLECSGPLYSRMQREGGALRLRFDHAQGLHARGGPPAHFVVAGEDARWEAAQARIEGESIVVSSAKVPVPLQARFAWCEDCETNLFNAAGLPASPFRTDTWD